MRTKRMNVRGSAILVVLGIVAVVSIVCAMLGLAANQQMHSSKITRDTMKARTIAELQTRRALAELDQVSGGKAFLEALITTMGSRSK